MALVTDFASWAVIAVVAAGLVLLIRRGNKRTREHYFQEDCSDQQESPRPWSLHAMKHSQENRVWTIFDASGYVVACSSLYADRAGGETTGRAIVARANGR